MTAISEIDIEPEHNNTPTCFYPMIVQNNKLWNGPGFPFYSPYHLLNIGIIIIETISSL